MGGWRDRCLDLELPQRARCGEYRERFEVVEEATRGKGISLHVFLQCGWGNLEVVHSAQGRGQLVLFGGEEGDVQVFGCSAGLVCIVAFAVEDDCEFVCEDIGMELADS